MNIGLLIDPSDICYGTLNYFLAGIEKALQRFAIHTERIAEINNDVYAKRWDAFIGFNRLEPAVLAEDGTYFMDSYFGCPYFNILVDAPYYHHEGLRAHMNNLHVIFMDRGHADYCKKHYPPCKSAEMGYLLGPVGKPAVYDERGIDLLFTGTYTDYDFIKREFFSSKYPDDARNVFAYMIENGITYPEKTIEELFKEYLTNNMTQTESVNIPDMIHYIGVHAERYLRAYFREKVILSVVNDGLNVTIAGKDWERCFQKCPDNLTLIGGMGVEQTADLMANAKILLNVMPWFKAGMHDRIPTSMHNGAVCVTDSSSYIDEHFEDGKNIVLYQLDKLYQLPDKCRYLLEHPQEAGMIAQAGKKKADLEYTWEKFVLDYILKWLW